MDGTAYNTDRNDNPNVFNLNADGAKLKLNANNAKPDNRWNSDNQFVFLFRKCILFRAFIERGFSFPDFLGFFSSHLEFVRLLQALEQFLRIVYVK